MKHLAPGLYKALLDESLRDALARHPELRRVFGKIDPEEQPGLYASFVAKVLEQALREESDPERRLALCNRILGQVANEPGRGHLEKHRLVPEQKPLLLEITPPNYGRSGIPRPHTPLAGRRKRSSPPAPCMQITPSAGELLHWESQANTAQHHTDGQNLIHHHERGYTVLVFARGQKKRNGVTVPFTYLGPVDMESYEGERPIKMVWRLRYAMPVEMFEDNRRGG